MCVCVVCGCVWVCVHVCVSTRSVLPQEDVRISLERVIELENESVWSVSKELEMEDDVLCSPFPMDIWTVSVHTFHTSLIKT